MKNHGKELAVLLHEIPDHKGQIINSEWAYTLFISPHVKYTQESTYNFLFINFR